MLHPSHQPTARRHPVLDVTHIHQSPLTFEDRPASFCPEAATRAPVSLNIEQLAPDERLHTDLSQDSTIAVIEGVFYAVVGENEQVLTPGDQIDIPAGTPRSIWNAGDEPARAITGCSPA
jgi:mannose-6-phosphate isomerase-like protein (cupin superfamily)